MKFYLCRMKLFRKICCILVIMLMLLPALTSELFGQCSICTRSVQQLGERPARALNTGVLYLAAAPLMIAGFIGYRWWKSDNANPDTRI